MAMSARLMIKDFYFNQERKIFLTGEGVESVQLSLTIKCSKADFAKSVEWAAKELAATDLKDIKKISIILEASD
jgi:Zn-dependent M16 (insulinase) family peptidase